MLRASSLGLTFTHGISRHSLLQRHRLLHKQLVREPVLFVYGIPREHSTTKTEVAEEIAMAEDTPRSPTPHSPPTSISVHEDNPTPTESQSQVASSSQSHPRLRPMTSTPRSVSRISPEVKGPRSSPPVKKRRPPRYMLSRWAYQEHSDRLVLYKKLTEATDVEEAWGTYQQLLSTRPPHVKQLIPQKYLHGFAVRLVAHSRWMPSFKIRTQTVFHRLLSVLNTIYYSGGQVLLWEWNALVECAGRGWRKTRIEDYNRALKIYEDMVANRAPGSSLSDDAFVSVQDEARVASQPVTPDIVTYTTLLHLAGRTRNPTVLRQAEEILFASGHVPNRITQLVYVRYFTRRGQLMGVRSILSRMEANGMELGIDGVNACVWAFGRNGRVDISVRIYHILRHYLLSDKETNPEAMAQHESRVKELYETEGLTVPAGLKPDAITYYTLIQVAAYHGHFDLCRTVFIEMMTSPQRITGPLEDMDVVSSGPRTPDPVLPIFRSIFLGFARYGKSPKQHSDSAIHRRTTSETWTLQQLHALFENFVNLPQNARPNTRTVYWILSAYAITSGYNREILRRVWEKLSARYGERWDGRVHEFRNKIYEDTFDDAYFGRIRAASGREKGP